MTFLWQEQRGAKHYRLQTDDKSILSKVKRRKNFLPTMIPIKGNIWVFSCQFTRPDIAKKTIKSITGKNPKIDSEGVIIYE